MNVSLRDVIESDLLPFYEHQADRVAAEQAQLPTRDRPAFLAHWKNKVLASPEVVKRTILLDGEVAGNLICWTQGDRRLVGYWVDRKAWGRQVATTALRLFLRDVPVRPLHAYVATANAPSIRVLEKCGFRRISDAPLAGPDGVEEALFRLDS